MKISGAIQSGVGKGTFFTTVDWVVCQCREQLGFAPYPGTLNVRVCDKDLDKLDDFFETCDMELIPDDPSFCSAPVKKVVLDGIPAAVVLPAEEVRIHDDQIIEIISACGFKESLKLEDGDLVTISDQKEKGMNKMDIHSEIYEFASSAGALEGYVFSRAGVKRKR